MSMAIDGSMAAGDMAREMIGRLRSGNTEQMAQDLTTKVMDRADANGDGALGFEELSNAASKKAVENGRSFDSAKFQERFDAMDGDGDGQLSTSELTSGIEGKLGELKDRLTERLQSDAGFMQRRAMSGKNASAGAAAYQDQMDVLMNMVGTTSDGSSSQTNQAQTA